MVIELNNDEDEPIINEIQTSKLNDLCVWTQSTKSIVFFDLKNVKKLKTYSNWWLNMN